MAATAARLRSSLRCRHCLTPSASASRWCRPRATRISCCSPARSPARCARLRCAPGSLRRIRKSASPTVPAATAAASSTIFTASGAAPTKSCRWTSVPGCPPTPAATLYGFAMALGLLEQKIHAREPRAGQPASHYPAPGHGAAAAGEDRPHGTQAGGLPLRTPDCRRLSASAQPATIR